MANHKRRRPRTSGAHSPHVGRDTRNPDHPMYYNWLANWPRWWDIVFHRRPERRRTKAMVRRIMLGQLDADDAAWPVPKKPHQYFW